MDYKVEKTSEDGLTVDVWRFGLVDQRLVLNLYCRIVRENKRRKKGKVEKYYSRLLPGVSDIAESDIPWSDEIAEEALRTYMLNIRVGRWETDFGFK